jgi:hypothetical protein
MKALAFVSITLAFLVQAGTPSPSPTLRDLLRAERPLTSDEIAIVLGASRDAVAGKTLKLSYNPVQPATEVLVGRMGQPRFVRMFSGVEGGTVTPAAPGSAAPGSASPMIQTRWREDRVTIIDYTGRPARPCAGLREGEAPEPVELVIEYTQRSSATTTPTWTVKARKRAEREQGGPAITPVFEMLMGRAAVGTVTSGEHRQIRGRQARAFVAPWITPNARSTGRLPPVKGDPIPNVQGEPRPRAETAPPTQWLWIDTTSLLPLRWEVFGGYPRYLDIGVESFDLQPPDGLDVPDCIS